MVTDGDCLQGSRWTQNGTGAGGGSLVWVTLGVGRHECGGRGTSPALLGLMLTGWKPEGEDGPSRPRPSPVPPFLRQYTRMRRAAARGGTRPGCEAHMRDPVLWARSSCGEAQP